jgi:hypothetical protein
MAPKAPKVLKTMMKKPAAKAEALPRGGHEGRHGGGTYSDKGTSSLMEIDIQTPMGKNAAQAIQDTLKN